MIVHFINLNNFLEREYFSKFCLESWKKYMPDAEIKVWTSAALEAKALSPVDKALTVT